jgi:DNA-binding response OmpR family regulator
MQPEATDAAAARILVMDDDPALLTTLTTILASQGFEVDTATDGAEGLAHARERCPALVILDALMPVLDGYAFLDAFRALPACADVPVILMTGTRESGAARQRLATRGVVMQIAKPFDLDTLLAAVRGALRSRQRGG